jgi:hypothetical protein
MESAGFVIVEKLVKGGIFSLISMYMMYFIKIYSQETNAEQKTWINKNRADREYYINSKKG